MLSSSLRTSLSSTTLIFEYREYWFQSRIHFELLVCQSRLYGYYYKHSWKIPVASFLRALLRLSLRFQLSGKESMRRHESVRWEANSAPFWSLDMLTLIDTAWLPHSRRPQRSHGYYCAICSFSSGGNTKTQRILWFVPTAKAWAQVKRKPNAFYDSCLWPRLRHE